MPNISEDALPPSAQHLGETTQSTVIQKEPKIKTDKAIGYALLTVGLLTILVTSVLLFNLLTGKSKPPTVFNVKAPTFSLNPTQNLAVDEGSLPPGVKLNNQNQQPAEVKLFTDELYNTMLNMVVFYLLMFFLAARGASLSSLGINLIKDIRVEIKEEKIKAS